MLTQPTPDTGCPNAEVAAGLRTLAAFLDAHPELPVARFATVSLRSVQDGRPARETLELVAYALGEQAIEQHVSVVDQVQIRGEFEGGVKLVAAASPRELADAAPEVAYEPIMAKPGPELLAALDRAIDELGLEPLKAVA